MKTKVKGPAAFSKDEGEDIIDETLKYFKPNMFFRNYEVQGPADRILLYLTFYTHQCLMRIRRCKNKTDADKTLYLVALEQFDCPGDRNFILGGFLGKPDNNKEKELWRSYIKQCRQELGLRLTPLVFPDEKAPPSKFWMCFVKRKFLGKAFEN